MPNSKRVTIKEVARASGVSTQTVSRVLNNRPDVSAETRERIREIIANLGYSPNILARSLIQGRSHTLGVIGYGLSYYGPSRVLTGIQRRASELGYSLLLSLVREPESNLDEEIFQSLLARQVDGIIWAIPEISANREWVADARRRLSVPLAFINMEPTEGFSVASIDNFAGGKIATQHLLKEGFRQIGIITGPETWWEARQREKGWRDAMQAAGISDLDSLKICGDWYPSSGETGLEALLQRNPDLEAVFACNDSMASGVLCAARRLGKRVPQDLAVVGFDDTPESSYYYPSLTTLRQPLAELGGVAVDMLDKMQASAENEAEAILTLTKWMEPALVVRDSSIRKP